MFHNPEKNNIKLNGVFQIWAKNENNEEYEIKRKEEEDIKV